MHEISSFINFLFYDAWWNIVINFFDIILIKKTFITFKGYFTVKKIYYMSFNPQNQGNKWKSESELCKEPYDAITFF